MFDDCESFRLLFGVRILSDCCYKNCYEVPVRAYGLSPLKPQRGRRENFLTPSNSHLIRIPITVFITSERFFPFKKGLKILRHQRLFLNLRTFLDSGLERGVCLPAKNPEKEKERAERGMECEVND